MKWWNNFAQLNRTQRQHGYGLAVLFLLLSGVIGSCDVQERPLVMRSITETPAQRSRSSLSLDAVSRSMAIADVASASTSATTPAGPQTIGYSVGGLPIESYRYGDGPIRVVFVGGIHGGTEWNTIQLAYTAIDYFDHHPEMVPAEMTVYIIPTANPDGQRLVTGSWGRFLPDEVGVPVAEARFNRNGVDLNRNWGCDWAETARWGTVETSGGSAPFSEPETRALRDFFLGNGNPMQAVIFWHSAVPGVFAGGCEGIYPAAERLATVYGNDAGYPYGDSFGYYPITGDATNWLSQQRIPAITVELRTRDDPEWPQNLAAILATLDYLRGGNPIVGDIAGGAMPIDRQIAR